jgi:methyl-accepting chemotaxis protein
MDMNVRAGKSGGKEKKKRGRKPKADKQLHRYMIRLNSKDHERFSQLYERSGYKSKSQFMADCILNRPLKMVEINKSAIDFVMLLSSFFVQFRAIKNNFNQMYGVLVRNFGEEKARLMIRIVEQSTREFGLLKREFEEYVAKLKEQCFPK